MTRWNAEGVHLKDLPYALSRVDIVSLYRNMNRCMLCMRVGVNEAGVCGVCYSMLDGEPLKAVLEWTMGKRP
ncbi:MAG: hypothetical protein K8R88_13280 [Armatimonadetes bacterium]|nr:hypothetical protein [Armatimonadota bacterium]